MDRRISHTNIDLNHNDPKVDDSKIIILAL